MTLDEGVAERPNMRRRAGRAEGISCGLEVGITQQRMLLRRRAAARFGAATADRLANALAGEAASERLAEVGEATLHCATGDEPLPEAGVSS